MRISIPEARVLQQEGAFQANPNYMIGGHPDREVESLFRASYLITWRPEKLAESEQYAIAERI